MPHLAYCSPPHVGHARRLTIAAVLLMCFPLTQNAFAQLTSSSDFTIIVLPDTQNESQYSPQMFFAQTDWIVKNKVKYNIQMVLGEGDIVNDGASTTQQQNADSAIRILDNAKIPYLLAIGNHDYDGSNAGATIRKADGFNKWWGPTRYSGYSYYKGPGYPAGTNQNFYGVLTINSTPYLFLILEYVPRTAALNWATSVLNANPDKDVIIVSHSNLYSDGTRVDRCDTGDLNRDNDGDDTWTAFVSRFPRIHLVLSGHITNKQSARRADLGINGNLINQIFANYQDEDHGHGWLRIMTFHPFTNTVSVSTHSPFDPLATKNDSFTMNYRNPGAPAGSTGAISGLVRGDRMSNTYSCRRVSAAAVTTSTGSTTTTSTGHYTFSTLVPNTYTLTVKAKGWYSATVSAKVNGTYTTDQNIFLQPIVGAANGRVLTRTGAAISGATVKFVGGTLATSRTATTNANGVYSITMLSVGSYQVTAAAAGFAGATRSATINASATTTIGFTL